MAYRNQWKRDLPEMDGFALLGQGRPGRWFNAVWKVIQAVKGRRGVSPVKNVNSDLYSWAKQGIFSSRVV